MRLWRGERQNGEVDEEIRAHLRMAVQARIERGESPEEAERNALREFGNELLVRETTRDIHGGAVLEKLVRDVRYALRQLRRAPGFAAIAMGTLALGLGATTAMFSIVNSVLLEPLKYPDPGRLYSVVDLPSKSAPYLGNWLLNPRQYSRWRTNCEACEEVALAQNTRVILTGESEPERMPALRVSANFFGTLGVPAAMGRTFRPEEELPGKDREVILSDSCWHSRFLADPGVLGRTIRIDSQQVTVIGVMPPGFQVPVGGQWGEQLLNVANAPQPAMFIPLGMDLTKEAPDNHYDYVSIARLKPGATPAEAAAEFQASILDFVRQYHIGLRPALLPLQDTMVSGARAALWLLLATVGAVLLIVCVNIGNLMLVRTSSRDREAGIRMALGASRGELFRLVLTEALVLIAAGAAAGLGLAYAALRAFQAVAPAEVPRIAEVHIDARAVLFALGAALVSAMLCGLFPAWRLSRTDPQESLKTGALNATAQGRKLRLRELLVSAEVALSTLLLVIGGLLLLSFYRVMHVPTGFHAEHVITQETVIDAKRIDEALSRLGGIPGVQAAGVTNQLPLRGETWICQLRDARSPNPVGIATADFRFVSPGYWAAMGIPLIEGRLLSAADRGHPVAVMDQQSAQMLFPGRDPVGRRIDGCGDHEVPVEVVGVVGNVRSELEQKPPVTLYQGYWDGDYGSHSFVVRTEANPTTITAEVRQVLRSIDRSAALMPASTMEQVMDDSAANRRFEMELAVGFAIVALLLASLGVYGVISFTVARRTPEIGIRIALGARAPQLAGMVLRQGMAPVAIGLAAGVAAALLAGRFVASQLFGVAPDDPWTIGSVAMLLIAVAAGACWIPARRAMNIDPITALRFE